MLPDLHRQRGADLVSSFADGHEPTGGTHGSAAKCAAAQSDSGQSGNAPDDGKNVNAQHVDAAQSATDSASAGPSCQRVDGHRHRSSQRLSSASQCPNSIRDRQRSAIATGQRGQHGPVPSAIGEGHLQDLHRRPNGPSGLSQRLCGHGRRTQRDSRFALKLYLPTQAHRHKPVGFFHGLAQPPRLTPAPKYVTVLTLEKNRPLLPLGPPVISPSF